MMDERRDGSRLATGLGAFSLALGTAEMTAPGAVGRLVGAHDDARTRAVLRWLGGLREFTAGAGILGSKRPAGWLWARVGGDMLDLAMLARGPMTRQQPAARRRAACALASVAAVTAADVVAATRSWSANGAASAVTAAGRITVNRPVAEVYAYWRQLENLPDFMTHLLSVQQIGGGRSRWKASGPMGVAVAWEAEISAERVDEVIAWRSTDEATVANVGHVEFRSAPGGRGTEVRVELSYHPPGGKAGAAVATLLGEEPGQQIRDDLRRFKQLLEVGEVVRSEGSPEGADVRRLPTQYPGQPVTS